MFGIPFHTDFNDDTSGVTNVDVTNDINASCYLFPLIIIGRAPAAFLRPLHSMGARLRSTTVNGRGCHLGAKRTGMPCFCLTGWGI